MSQKARLAASVVLLRAIGPRGFEVLLTRSPDGMAFRADAYGFPGGTLRKEDFSEAMLRRARGITPVQAQKIIGAEFAPRQAVGLWIAAIRELFEETGSLLAANGAGEPVLTKEQLGDRSRVRLLGKTVNLLDLLESKGLFCDLSALAHFSHWRTPAHVSARFDTHFFLAAVPPDQHFLLTPSELSRGVWVTPDRALRLFNNNELPMIFPTFASLRTLADHDSLASVLKDYRAGNHKS
jgi:8-oxo-dGTP pyrophosphatase MutT (NUDIX family)